MFFFAAGASFIATALGIGRRSCTLILLLCAILPLCLLNAGKVIESDWAWYTTHYQLIANFSVSEYLGTKIGVITVKRTEPVYYLIAWAVYHVTGGNTAALAVSVTTIIYGLMGITISTIASHIMPNNDNRNNAFIIVGITLLSVTFTLVTQLVRQEIALSFAALAFAMLVSGRSAIAWVLGIVAVATHQSAVLFMFALFAPYVVTRPKSRTRGAGVGLTLLLLGLASVIGYALSVSALAEGASKDDGSISSALVIFDFTLFVILAAMAYVKRVRYLQHVALSFMLLYAALLPVVNLPLALLRLYFYIDFLRGAALLALYSTWIRKESSNFLSLTLGALVLVSALLYIDFRIERSPFTYPSDLMDALAFPI